MPSTRWRKGLRKFLKISFLSLAAFAGVVVVLIVAIVSVIWWKPELVVSSETLRWVAKKAPQELQISWREFQFSTRPLSLFSKTVTLKTEDLCVHWRSFLETCAPEVGLEFDFAISTTGIQLLDLRKVRLAVNKLELWTPSAPQSSQQELPPLPDLRLPALETIVSKGLDLHQLGEVDVQVHELIWHRPQKKNELKNEAKGEGAPAATEGPLVASFQLQREMQDPSRLNLRLQAEISQDLSLRGHMSGDFAFQPADPTLQFKGKINLVTGALTMESPVEITYATHLDVRAEPSLNLKANSMKFRAPLHLVWSHETLVLQTGRLALERLWTQGNFDIAGCRLESRFEEELGYPQHSHLSCDLQVKLREKRPPVERVRGKLTADLVLQPRSHEIFLAGLKVRLQGEEKFGQGRVDGQVEFEGHAKEFKILNTPRLNLVADLKIPEVQVWVQAFKDTPLGVPAPLHTLKGPIQLNATSEIENVTQNLVLKGSVTTSLKDPSQSVVTRTDFVGTLLAPVLKPKGLTIDLMARLQDVRMVAPPLRLQSPPQFLPDKRFVSEKNLKQKNVSSFPVNWSLKIITEKPLTISSNLLKAPLPVALNLQLASRQNMRGELRVQSLPLELFRKQAQLEEVLVSFEPSSKYGLLDGLVRYETSEVKVRILILGTTQKPRVEFLSDPPLNRSQILSVILYNKSLHELTEEEASSAGNFGKALGDGAFGLFSLLFLSSTPIQSVSYDPATQSYNARVRLDDKTSLNLGSDFSDSRQFTVRRRLQGRWVLSTELRQEENEPDSVLTLLEWFRRYQ